METATATKTKWNLDAAHSEITFKVKHMMIANVTGTFGSFAVDTQTEGDDFTTAGITFSTAVSSISTGSADRDNHLKSGDFFNAEAFPEIKFVSTKVEKKSSDEYVLQGNLTIKDVTKPVKLDVEFGGIGKDPWGNQKAGFTLTGKINRTDFGLTWNAALETGGVLVGEDVKIHAEIQLIKA
ncbi:YceI family protein [Chryseolinea lacunae]|uniref:YceI family protein n=1 Tax=Chryseolinea lacunae TaxID=2801331 RepID=A0ABS1L1M9_9BACT|nr:YceI family protein [Chryseolinea lacunae]MBL0745621.1 YceI family protein [Chryseolinea lacunae]